MKLLDVVADPTSKEDGATYVGVAPEPAEVRIYPEFEFAVNLPQVFAVLA